MRQHLALRSITSSATRAGSVSLPFSTPAFAGQRDARARGISKRNIVTSSVEPPVHLDDGYMERPGVLALIESTSMYKDSWTKSFASTFPSRGVHFMSIDLSSCISNNADSSVMVGESFNRMHTELATDLSSHAEVILVARGPLPSVIAQYYLESLPLSGLIMVDPLLIPPGREENEDNDDKSPNLQKSAQSLLQKLPSANDTEVLLVDALQHDMSYNRPLKLEAGCVPVRVMYTSEGAYEDEFQHCAELTAARHNPKDGRGMWGDVVAQKISKTDDDESIILESIYQWIDEII